MDSKPWSKAHEDFNSSNLSYIIDNGGNLAVAETRKLLNKGRAKSISQIYNFSKEDKYNILDVGAGYGVSIEGF